MTPGRVRQCGPKNNHSTPRNLTASGAGPCVAGLQRLLSAALAEIVSAGVDNDGALLQVNNCLRKALAKTYANDALRADELDELVGHRALGVTLGIRLDVAEVADVAVLVGRGAVSLVVGVDCAIGLRVSEEVGESGTTRGTYSAGQQKCSRWCCHQRCGCACRA